MAKADLTAQRLREILDYDPTTGALTWRARPGRKFVFAGRTANCIDHYGYVVVYSNALGGQFAGHRLAWLHRFGVWPKGQIDHINGDRTDNRIDNLRDVSIASNLQNISRARKHNKSGFLGVTTAKGGFIAEIEHHKKRTYLGWFKTAEAAHAAYIQAKRELHLTCRI